jgi:hypothetical protein
MKKVLLAAFTLLSLSQTTIAQQQSILAAGNIGIATAKSPASPNDNKQTSFYFNPTIGYQFTNHWTGGIVADLQNSKITNSNNTVNKNSNFGAGPFVRYTKSLTDIFSLFGQLQGTFSTSKFNGTKTGSYTSVNAFPAVFVHVKNGFGLNFNFGGISYNSYKPTGASANTGFNVTFGQSANIGISKNFSLKKK